MLKHSVSSWSAVRIILPYQGLVETCLTYLFEALAGLKFCSSELWVMEDLMCTSPLVNVACSEATELTRHLCISYLGKPFNPSVLLLVYSQKNNFECWECCICLQNVTCVITLHCSERPPEKQLWKTAELQTNIYLSVLQIINVYNIQIPWSVLLIMQKRHFFNTSFWGCL